MRDAFALLFLIATFNYTWTDNHIMDWLPFVIKQENCAELLFEAIKSIFSTPYWSRVWIIQEIALPPGAIVVYGSIVLPWDTIAGASRY